MSFLDSSTTSPLAPSPVPKPSLGPDLTQRPSSPPLQEAKDGYMTNISKIGQGEVEGAKRAQAIDSNFKMQPPKLELPPKPEMKETDPVQAWGSMAMVFAALASIKSRTPMTTALNASAEALKAIKQGDKDTYDRKMKEWEVQSKNALDMAHFQNDLYKTALGRAMHEEDLAMKAGEATDKATQAKVSAIAHAMQDPAMVQASEMGTDAMVTLQKKREEMARQLEERKIGMSKAALEQQRVMTAQQIISSPAYTDLTQKAAKAREAGDSEAAIALDIQRMQMLEPSDPERIGKSIIDLQQRQEKLKTDREKYEESAQHRAAEQYDQWKSTPEGQAATPEESFKKQNEIYSAAQVNGKRVYPQISAQNKPFIAMSLASYEMKPPTDYLLSRDPQWLEAMEEAKKINPDFNPAKYDLIRKAREKLQTGKDADAVASYVRLSQHLQFFEGLINQLSNGADMKTLNGLATAWGRQTGNTNVTSYETAMELVGDEIVKAAAGTGAAGALADRESIKKNFDPSLTKEQLRANVDAVKHLVGGAITATIGKYKNLFSPQELQSVSGLSKDQYQEFYVNPDDLKPTVTGPVTFNGHTVDLTPRGADGPVQNPGQSNQQPSASGVQNVLKRKDGVYQGTINGQPVLSKDGQSWIDLKGNPIQ